MVILFRGSSFQKFVHLCFFTLLAHGVPVSFGACQTACNAGAVACYAAAGLTFGAVTAGAGAPAAALACNSVLGTCMSACAAKFLVEGGAETAVAGGVMGPVVAVGGAVLATGAAGVTWWAGKSALGGAGATTATDADGGTAAGAGVAAATGAGGGTAAGAGVATATAAGAGVATATAAGGATAAGAAVFRTGEAVSDDGAAGQFVEEFPTDLLVRLNEAAEGTAAGAEGRVLHIASGKVAVLLSTGTVAHVDPSILRPVVDGTVAAEKLHAALTESQHSSCTALLHHVSHVTKTLAPAAKCFVPKLAMTGGCQQVGQATDGSRKYSSRINKLFRYPSSTPWFRFVRKFLVRSKL